MLTASAGDNTYDALLRDALTHYEAALGRVNSAVTPIHPTRDFEKMCVVFCMWKRLMRGDQRAICCLTAKEAHHMFVEFAIEFNDFRLPIEFYRSFPEAAEVSRLPAESALRRVLEATHTRDLFSHDEG
jgi:hypothetical protein